MLLFYVLLTVHLSIILATDQLNVQILLFYVLLTVHLSIILAID